MIIIIIHLSWLYFYKKFSRLAANDPFLGMEGILSNLIERKEVFFQTHHHHHGSSSSQLSGVQWGAH
jgi:hypothetical protein